MGIKIWADTATICCILLPAIVSAGLLIDPLPSSLKRPEGQYDAASSTGDNLNTTFVDGNFSVTIVNTTIGDPLVILAENNSSSNPQTFLGKPEEQDIRTGDTDDMAEAASVYRPRFGGYYGGYRRPYRPWGGYSGGWGRPSWGYRRPPYWG